MKIWLVNPFDPLASESFRPGRYTTLVKLLIQNGHKVTWWSSNFFHMTKSYRKIIKKEPNLRIILLPTPKYTKNIGLGRIRNHYIYTKKFEQQAKEDDDVPDVIIASCPPLLSAKASIKIAKRLKTKCVIDIRDLWPEASEMLMPSKIAKILFSPIRKYADSIYNSADAIMVVSQTYRNRAILVCKNRSKEFIILPLGIDLSLFDTFYKKENSFILKKKKDEFWLTYIGTIGKSYDLRTILKCAQIFLASRPNIKFFIAGGGPDLLEIKKIATSNKLTNCMLTDWLNFENMIYLLKQSDVGFNTIISKSKTSLPNKLFDYMAAKLPIINSVRGELEDLLKSKNIGVQYTAGDVDSLREAILYLYNHSRECKIMGENARELCEEHFDRNKIYPEIENFLKKVVNS